MIKFKAIEYKNFLSSGAQPLRIELDKFNTTLIVGTNGSGKSTILDALSYVLFNKAHRKINLPQLINTINGKNMLVTIEFSIGNVEYKIVRGMKPNIFEIHQNGKLLNQDSHSKDYQRILENNILKMNHKTFHQIVVLGSGNFTPFMQLPAGARREVIEDLLDIGIFSKMLYLLKIRVTNIKNQIQANSEKIRILNEKIALQTRHINELKSIDDNASMEIEKEITELSFQLKELETLNSRLMDEATSKILNDDIENCRDSINKMKTVESQLLSGIKGIEKSIKFYMDNDICPSCAQSIDNDLKTRTIEKLVKDREELEAKHDTAIAHSTNLLDEMERFNSEIARVNRINTTVSQNNSKMNHLQDSIVRAQNKLKTKKTIDTSGAEQELIGHHSDINKINKETQIIKNLANICDFIESLLKDSGIKSTIIKQYLPVMNSVVNQYLQTLDFFISFNIDEEFNETIKSRHRDVFTYASFSEGEKAKIDLSLMLTWRQIAKMKNSISTNILILDEVCEANLDSVGSQYLLNILSSLGAGTNVIVITHKAEILDGKFDCKIEVTKENNFSKITMD